MFFLYKGISLVIQPRSFYARDTVEVARDVLGKKLIRVLAGQQLEAIIVETEAYRHADDPASHAYRGKTKRTEVMFGPVGHAYVYFIYGNWYCLNVVARDHDQPAGAVLIRAVEPLTGIAFMQKKRNTQSLTLLTNGPGKLTQALQITKRQNGIDMTKKGQLYITDTGKQDLQIAKTGRIGISQARDMHWRFYIQGNPWVSR